MEASGGYLVSAYCSITEVQNIWSEDGVMRRTDDDPEDVLDSSEVTAVIAQASSRIDMYLGRRYSSSALNGNAWVTWCCAYLSACLLSKRRGNPCPESIGAECQQYVEWLKEIRDGLMDVPDTAPEHDVLPAVSNLTVDARWRRTKVRRVASTSTRDNPPPSPVKRYDAWEWNQWP